MLKNLVALIFLLFTVISFAQDSEFKLQNLEINSQYPHFGINMFGDNQIVFTSYLLNKKGKIKKAFSGEGILTVYKGIINSEGQIQNVEALKIDSKASIENITSAAISSNGKKLYITTQYTNKNIPKGNFNKANFHIEVGEYKSGVGFTNFQVLPFCKPRFSYAHPTLSSDGKTLYFTANVRGGKETTKGGSDIFKAEISSDNTFGSIKNLGSKVNSYSREMFPTIGNDNTLYFACNKSNGFGGYDLYKTKMNTDGTFNKAEKLPKPINSKADDLSLVMLPNVNSGFIVSKRKGGKGDDDIYYFSLK